VGKWLMAGSATTSGDWPSVMDFSGGDMMIAGRKRFSWQSRVSLSI
jgi:hypothetical protein